MSGWRTQLKDLLKVLIVFIICTCFFYVALKMVHEEYERQHRYDPPGGAAVKVFKTGDLEWTERLSVFFRLGE